MTIDYSNVSAGCARESMNHYWKKHKPVTFISVLVVYDYIMK